MAEDLIARYQLDISDLKLQVAELQKQYSKLSDAEKKAGKDGEDAAKKTAQETEKAAKSTGLLSEQIETLGKQLVAAFAIERIIAFGEESVKAFADAEAAAKKLETAVGVRGGINKDFENLIQQSSRLQSITIFSDDDIQAAQTAALQYGFTADQVQKLIPTIIDLASATGSDLQSALNSVITATEGSERALRGQGIVVDSNIPKAENFNRIIEQLNKNFEGQGVIVGETAAGALKKYENQVGELQESLGEKLFPVIESLKLGILAFTNDLINAFNPDTYKAKEITQQIIDDTALINSTLAKTSDEEIKRIIKRQQLQVEYNGIKMSGLEKESDEYSILEEQNKRSLNFIKLYSDELVKRLTPIKAANDLEKLGLDELKKRRDELKTKSDFNSRSELEQIDKIIKKREEALKKQEEENKKLREEQKKNLEALIKFSEDANKQLLIDTASTEAEKLRIQKQAALQQAKQLFEAAGGTKNTEAVKAYNDAVLAIETDYAERIKQARLKAIQSTFDEQSKLNKENSDNELKNSLSNIESNQNAQILALKQAYVAKGDFSKDAEKKLQDDITKIQIESERKRAEEAYRIKQKQIDDEKTLAIQAAIQRAVVDDGSVGLQLLNNNNLLNAINKAYKDSNDKKLDNDKSYADALAKLGLKIVDGQIKSSTDISTNWIQTNEEKITKAQQAADEIINTFNAILSAQIDSKQRELEELQSSYDEQDAELQFRYEKRLIGAGDFEKEQNKIKEQRIASEKKIQSEINKLKRQEDLANRARSIFDITINTAVAISKILDKPFLIALVALAGAAQLATVLSTPLPKYAKGTKYLQRGNNPLGVDTIPILANEGERIISSEQNKKHWSIYEALDENKWNQFVQRNYIAPALNKQLQEYKKNESESFAENVSRSLIFNHDLLATKIGAEIEWRNRNGIKVKGMNELIDALSKTIDPRKR